MVGDPAGSGSKETRQTQRGQRPRVRAQARQTRRGQRPKGLGEHRRCGVALLIHRGVSPGGRDAPGSKHQNSPVLLVVFLVGFGSLAVFSVPPKPGRCGVVLGARPYEAGRASEIVAHWCDFKAGIPSTNSVKPTQPVSVSKVRPRASRSSSAVEGRRATDKTHRKGPQPEDWRAQALT